MISLFSVFKVIELQGNYMEELYDLGENKLTWMLVVTFLHCTSILYISIMHIL